VDKLDSSAVVRPIPFSQNGYGFLYLNSFARKGTKAPHPILADLRVRRAISMALDRKAMLANVFKTSGRIAYGPFPTGVELADTTLAAPAFDTTAAGKLLDEAGWKRGPDGVRVKNGKPLALDLLTPSTSTIRLRYAELIQEELNRVGFKVEVARAAGPEFSAKT